MKSFNLLVAALPAVFAAPGSNTYNYCNQIDWLVSANHASSNAATFCSKYLSVSTSTVTKCATTTVTGAVTTSTCTITAKTAATVSSTTTVTATVTTSTTSYATSTCTPATPYTPPATTTTTSDAAANTDGLDKRTNRYPDKWCWSWNWPYPTPKYNPSQISAACSCIVTTPTATVTKTSTVTKPGPTSTKTTTVTVTTSTSTVYQTSTQVTTTTNTVTSTELRPYQPTGVYSSPNNATFETYSGVDFQRGDLDGGVFCSCDADGSGPQCNVRGNDYGKCFGFNSCLDICASINNNAKSLVCVGATYNGPDDSGACYFKQSLEGCGYYNDGRRSGLIELNGYSYASQK